MRMHDDYELIDRANVEEYRKHGVLDSETERYRCVVCGGFASISDSSSSRGHNLICDGCADAAGIKYDFPALMRFTRLGELPE